MQKSNSFSTWAGGTWMIPLLHIADPTGEAIQKQNIRKIGLLGTAFTMEGDFYKKRLQDQFGLDIMIPDPDDRAMVHRVIYEELVRGIISESSRQEYRRIIENLAEEGAEGVILGCTETPLFDTTTLHALAAVERSMSPFN